MNLPKFLQLNTERHATALYVRQRKKHYSNAHTIHYNIIQYNTIIDLCLRPVRLTITKAL